MKIEWNGTSFALVIIALLGLGLRIMNLGSAPFWCDEAYFALAVHTFKSTQEIVPALISLISGVDTEFSARLPFALAGTFTIIAIYLIRPDRPGLLASISVAFFPIFVFYSRMCRPYAMAGLFLAMGWKWKWAYIPMLFCTPTAIIGIDWFGLRKQKAFLISIIALTVYIFLDRQDLSREGFFTLDFLIGNPRLWYIPLLTIILYQLKYIYPWLETKVKERSLAYGIFVPGILLCVFLVSDIKELTVIRHGTFYRWYTHPIYYNDWRNMPPVDLSTNFSQIAEYYTGQPSVLLRRPQELTPDKIALTDWPKIDSILRTKDTTYIGVDSYANNLSSWFFPRDFLDTYGERLFNGEVILLQATKTDGQLIIQEVNKTARGNEYEYTRHWKPRGGGNRPS